MIKIMDVEIETIVPSSFEIFKEQGYPENSLPGENVIEISKKAQQIFKQLSNPRMMLTELSHKEFTDVLEGEGKNSDDIPVKTISSKADKIALFALTIGETLSREIEELFKSNEFPLGSMLDSVASLSAEKAVNVLEQRFTKRCREKYAYKEDYVTLAYSPGYCGWHISGQKKLFNYLIPQEIGIMLNESFLMTPLKSITGALLYGQKEIHLFDPGYEFCSYCRNQTCVERMKKLLGTKKI